MAEDKVSSIYQKALQKGLLAEGLTEDMFREQTSTDEGLQSFYDYATSRGMKFHPFPEFKERFRGVEKPTVAQNPAPTTEEEYQANQQAQQEAQGVEPLNVVGEQPAATASAPQEQAEPQQKGWFATAKEDIKQNFGNAEAWKQRAKIVPVKLTSSALRFMNGLMSGANAIMAGGYYEMPDGTLQKMPTIEEQYAAAERVRNGSTDKKDIEDSSMVRALEKGASIQEKVSKKANPVYLEDDEDFIQLAKDGKLSTLMQYGLGTAVESGVDNLLALSPMGRVALAGSVAGNRFHEKSIESMDDIPLWARAVSSLGEGAIAQWVESRFNPFKALDGLRKAGVKGVLKDIEERAGKSMYRFVARQLGKATFEEGIEEVEENTLDDILHNMLSLAPGAKGLGWKADFAKFKAEHQDIHDDEAVKEFAFDKAHEYLNDFIGGAMGGFFLGGGRMATGAKQLAQNAKDYSDLGMAMQDVAEDMGVTVKDIAEVYDEAAKMTADELEGRSDIAELNQRLRDAMQRRQSGEVEQAAPAPTQMENVTREVSDEVKQVMHANGYVYPVSEGGNAERTGYIVGDVVPVIDTSNQEKSIIANDDVVTVKWNDGTISQVAAKDLDLVGQPQLAQDYVMTKAEEVNTQITAERIQSGEQPVLMAKGNEVQGFFPTEDPNVLEDEYGNKFTREQLTEQGFAPVVDETQQATKKPLKIYKEYKEVDVTPQEQKEADEILKDKPYYTYLARTMGISTDKAIAMYNDYANRYNAGLVQATEEQPEAAPEPTPEPAPAAAEPVVEPTAEPEPAPAEEQTPNKPNFETMSPAELGASVVEYLGSKEDAKEYLEAELKKAKDALNAANKGKVVDFTDIDDFKSKRAAMQAEKDAAKARVTLLQEAIKEAKQYTPQAEVVAEPKQEPVAPAEEPQQPEEPAAAPVVEPTEEENKRKKAEGVYKITMNDVQPFISSMLETYKGMKELPNIDTFYQQRIGNALAETIPNLSDELKQQGTDYINNALEEIKGKNDKQSKIARYTYKRILDQLQGKAEQPAETETRQDDTQNEEVRAELTSILNKFDNGELNPSDPNLPYDTDDLRNAVKELLKKYNVPALQSAVDAIESRLEKEAENGVMTGSGVEDDEAALIQAMRDITGVQSPQANLQEEETPQEVNWNEPVYTLKDGREVTPATIQYKDFDNLKDVSYLQMAHLAILSNRAQNMETNGDFVNAYNTNAVRKNMFETLPDGQESLGVLRDMYDQVGYEYDLLPNKTDDWKEALKIVQGEIARRIDYLEPKPKKAKKSEKEEEPAATTVVAPTETAPKEPQENVYKQGDNVIYVAKDGAEYPAVVEERNSDGTYNLLYNNPLGLPVHIMNTSTEQIKAAKTESKSHSWENTQVGKLFTDFKERYPEALLLFREGDLYRSYKQDAEDAGKILEIERGSDESVPYIEFPFYDLDKHLPKLVKAGRRVAMIDQLEDPKQAKNLVKRGVTELVEPEKTAISTEQNAEKAENVSPSGKKLVTLQPNKNADAEVQQEQQRQIDFLNEKGVDKVIEEYITNSKNGNTLDPDELRKVFSEIGYDGSNVAQYKHVEQQLRWATYQRMLTEAVANGNNSIVILSGCPGCGKSTATGRESMQGVVKSAGVVFDAPFNTFGRIKDAVDEAKNFGIPEENVTIVCVYNDVLTNYNNTLERGVRTGRVMTTGYFLDCFANSNGKLADLQENLPKANIIYIDNSENNGGREIDAETASTVFDYDISDDQFNQLLNKLEEYVEQAEQGYPNGKGLTKNQLTTIAGGLQDAAASRPELGQNRAAQLVARIQRLDGGDGGQGVQPTSDERVRLTEEAKPATEGGKIITRELGTIKKSKHTKTGEDIWVVKPKDRYGNTAFAKLKKRAEELGGYYSNFASNRGFLFKNEQDAITFNTIEDEQTTDEIAANTTAIAEQAAVDSGKAEDVAVFAGTDESDEVPSVPERGSSEYDRQLEAHNQAITDIDNSLEKVNKQLALLGYYEADESDVNDFNEFYGYMKTAEVKAVKDADKLAKQLAKDLGIAINTRKKLARANIAPAGGDIYFSLPLENGKELYVTIDLSPNYSYYREDGNKDDLAATHLMYRVEDPSQSGVSRYVSGNQNFGTWRNNVLYLKYKELLDDIRIKARDYLPKPEVPASATTSDIVKAVVEKERAKQADTERIDDNAPLEEVFSGYAPEEPQQTEQQPKTIDNGVRNDRRRETDAAQGEPAGQPTDENQSLGGSEQQAVERPVAAGVDNSGREDRVNDRKGSRGTAGETVERRNVNNYRPKDGKNPAPLTNKARYEANMAAIRLLKELEEQGRQATPAEMDVLAKFSGWGGLGEFFNGEPGTIYYSRNGEKSPYQQIKEVLTDEELEAAQLSRNSAYFTPDNVIKAIWDLLDELGFKGGNITEGSAGIGNILALMPQKISDSSTLTAVEIDPITSGILAQLYPDASVYRMGFQEADIPNGSQDLCVTNVPFVTGLRVFDKKQKDLSKRFGNIHDFCIAKNVRLLKDGGVGVFITTSGTLDKSKDLRRWLNGEGNADVIGAFRLNNETFGGTKATSDIIVVRKRVNGVKDPRAIDVLDTETARIALQEKDEEWKNGKWVKPAPEEYKLVYNKYFVEHPENMGGDMEFAFEQGETWRETSVGCYPTAEIDQDTRLSDWSKSFKGGEAIKTYSTEPATDKYEKYEELKEPKRWGTLVTNSKGEICRASFNYAVPIDVKRDKVKGQPIATVLKDYDAIRTSLNALLEYQNKNEVDSELPKYLKALNKAYDSFVKKYGYLNNNVTLSWLREDIDFPSMAALENVRTTENINGKKNVVVTKSDVFSKRVIGVATERKPENATDGVILSVQQFGNVRPDVIAEWLGKPVEAVEKEIIESRLGYRDPQTGMILVPHEYLSGNVREKLEYAKEHNENGEYDTNIDALQKVIPMDIPAHLIEFNIGSTWIPKQLYEDYLKEKFDVTGLNLAHVGSAWVTSDNGKSWSLRSGNDKNKEEGVYSEVLHDHIYGHEIMLAAMNNKPIQVSKTTKYRDGHSETIHDKVATQACNDKAAQIKDDFIEWARDKMQQDPELAEKVEKIYNERFNAIVPMTKIDPRFMSPHLPNQNTKYTLYPHQQQAVIRGIMHPTMLAHEVGTGKTISLISTAMEMRRIGAAKKPMIVVQNATTPQFVREAKDLYPNAKVLTVSEKDRKKEGRQEFYAKIKYNDWDLIIIPQSVFNMIPDSEARVRDFIQEKIDEKMHAIEAAREAKVDSRILKQMERDLESLQDDIENGNMSGKKSKKKDDKKEAEQRANAEARAEEMLDRKTDDVENFDDMGVDALFVDEAHNYKHLGFSTMMTRGVKGVDPSYSKQAAALYLKCQSIYDRMGHKNVVFATGTPISNTAAEIWTFMKYLMPKEMMQENEIYYFDDFVHNFGKISQSLEFATNGKFKENTRFASYGNIPELQRLWLTVADCVLTREAEQVGGGKLSDKVPNIEGGKAKDIFLPQSPTLVDIMAAVRNTLDEYENMSAAEKKERSFIPLKMYSIAKRAAIDPRLVDPNAPDEPLSKTNKAVEEIMRSLDETKQYKGTVAVFCDNMNRKNPDTGKIEFNLFQDMRDKLVAKGVPESKIAIIESGMTDARKQKIFDAVREGDIRVIMGSTSTLGTGVNIQTRLHTLIHMDAPDRPMDYTQRNGRIVRQGNLHKDWGKDVRILRFGVEDSLDVTSYQRLKTKAGFIDSIMEGKNLIDNNLENRVLEEDEEGLFDNPVAVLSGSQYAMLKSAAERELRKWEGRYKNHNVDQIYVTNKLRSNASYRKYAEAKIASEEKRVAMFESRYPNGTISEYNINGTICTTQEEMKDAVKALTKEVAEHVDTLKKNVYTYEDSLHFLLGFNGANFDVDIKLARNVSYKGSERIVDVHKTIKFGSPELGEEKVGSPTKDLGRLVDHIQNDVLSGKESRELIESMRRGLDRVNKEDVSLRAKEGKPFENMAELEAARQKVAEYTELMKKELAEKEAKYASMVSGKEVELVEQDEENEPEIEESMSDFYSSEAIDIPYFGIEPNETLGEYAKRLEVENASIPYRKYQAMLENATSNKERADIMRAYMQEIGGDTDNSDIIYGRDDAKEFAREVMHLDEKGAESLADDVYSVDSFAVTIDGMYELFKGNNVVDLESVRSAMVHEDQHKRNKLDVTVIKDVIDNSTPAELAQFLQAINHGDTHYGDKYLYEGADGFRGLADELVAHGIQICYDTPIRDDDKVRDNLYAEGITNDKLIDIIYEEFLRQRKTNLHFLYQRGSRPRNHTPLRPDPRGGGHSRQTAGGTPRNGQEPNGQVGEHGQRGSVQNQWMRRSDTPRWLVELRRAAKQAADEWQERDKTQYTESVQVKDPYLIEQLENGEKIKVYRAMVLIDGKLYPPMSSKDNETKQLRAPIELGKWEQAEERPDLAIEKDGKWFFRLRKDDGSTVDAAYNPYFHTSRSPLNDQFTSAYNRPNLVTVEVEVPKSELTSGYRAEKAKDAVGEMTWHTGAVSGKLPDDRKRKVILTRWDKPIRIVPNAEVAEKIADLFWDRKPYMGYRGGKSVRIPIPYNVVTPALRLELEKLGLEISSEPSGNVSSPMPKLKPRVLRSPNGKKSKLYEERYENVRTDAFKNWFGDWENDPEHSSKVMDEKTQEPLVVYHGTPDASFDTFREGRPIWTYNKKNLAKQYTLRRGMISVAPSPRGNVIEGFMNLRNPLVIEVNGSFYRIQKPHLEAMLYDKPLQYRTLKREDFISADEAVNMVQETGEYDGVIFKNMADNMWTDDHEKSDVYVAFAPNQFKQADNQQFSESLNMNEAVYDPYAPQDDESTLSRHEKIVRTTVEMAKSNNNLVQAALKDVSHDLKGIRKAMRMQVDLDKSVVGSMLNLANTLLRSQWGGQNSEYKPSEIGAIATQIRNAVGKKDISKEVNKIMDYISDAQLRAAKKQWNGLLNTPIDKLNISGVVSQGKVAVQGQHALSTLKDAINTNLSVENMEEQLSHIEEDLKGETNASKRNELEGKKVGYMLACIYKDRVGELEEERATLGLEYEHCHNNKSLSSQARKEQEEAIKESMRENQAQQADAYIECAGYLQDYITQQHSIAKDFVSRMDANRDKIRGFAAKDTAGANLDPDRNRSKVSMARKLFNAFSSPIRDLQSMLRMTGLNSPDGEGYLYNHFMRGWTDAADEERRGVLAAQKEIDEKISELTNGKYKSWFDAAHDIKSKSHKKFEVDIIKSLDADGNMAVETATIDAGNALYIYAVNKMTDGQMKLRGMNITNEDVEKLVNEVREQFGQEIIDVVDWVQNDLFPRLRERYNVTHEAMFGAPMDEIDNYFPLRIDRDALQKNEDLSDPDTDVARLMAGTSTGAIKRRTKNSKPLDIRNADFFQEVVRHIAQMEHWNAFAQLNRDANILFSDTSFRNTIKKLDDKKGNIYGKGDKLYNNMKDAFMVAIGSYRPKTDEISEVVLNLAKGVTSAKINFRLFTALKQLASFPAFFPYMTDTTFVTSYVRNWAKAKETMKWAKENMPSFEKRISKRDLGDMRLMSRSSDWELQKRVLDNVSKFGMTPNILFDTLTCATGARAVYDSKFEKYIKTGYSQEEAHKRAIQDAEQSFNTSQQSSEGAYLSPIQQDRNAYTAALTVFRTASIQYSRNFVYHTRNLVRKFEKDARERQIAFRTQQYIEDGISQDKARAAAEEDYRKSIISDVIGFVTYGAVLNILWRLASRAMYLLLGDDDDKKKAVLEDAVTGGALVSPISGMLGGGLIENAIDGYATISDILSPELPLKQDVEMAEQYLKNDRYASAASQALAVLIQSASGFDPQTASNLITRIVTTLDSKEKLDTAEEAWRVTGAVLSMPESEYKQLMIDHVIKKPTEYERAADDYARYRAIRNAPLTWYLRDKETVQKDDEAAKKEFRRLYNERKKLKENR